MQAWHNVYDFANNAPVFSHFGFVFILIGLVFAGWKTYSSTKHSTEAETMPSFGMAKQPPLIRFKGIFMMCFAGLMLAIVLPSQIVGYLHTKSVYKQKQYQTIEGVVTDFDPMPEGGHQNESFVVSGVPFAFSNFDVTDYGYNNAASHGGAIREGLQVRIAYMANEKRNVILVLDTLAIKPNGK